MIASGGLNSLDDVKALCKVQHEGIIGAITGRAIYEGKLDFAGRSADSSRQERA